ncbi:MAG: translation initiation factor IF-2 [Candidatus Midichloria mitochondrii]|uniref:Translation initiation factor IF-2 n=1 Tax=Midichloria mitochondrii (strain IricVA) TaxID=696127 RepID=F7XVT0_MIDMI|nr:translation initiation factor IF-2 [Candidatus Midichloria mitochondrii]AEI88779.1 translation initiation factor IF-2 [Candidatus Midichloria mitochondrii IricVA]MDJ1256101.1 translation initiation factor IF-2 [Candidatus Midichloria mitochondrii]MDJ1287797.1 translation initiation factor IF-2 [Candidatus Midichloria mitochondrii]MDJ1298636.1 translation initiation factor IF-2 [Candidatus Midichloria mitochondrii]MDJ1312565.1 translation initiation factor IF-2 [Candidatus Midichloria mitoch
MTNSNDSNNTIKKPLGLSNSKLGLSSKQPLGKGQADALGPKSSPNRLRGSSSVIVITKNKPAPNSPTRTAPGALSKEEQEKRLRLLKMAEAEKSKQQRVIIKTETQKEEDIEKTNRSELVENSSESLSKEHSNTVISTEISENSAPSQEKTERRDFIKTLSSNRGKVRNLNQILTPSPQSNEDNEVEEVLKPFEEKNIRIISDTVVKKHHSIGAHKKKKGTPDEELESATQIKKVLGDADTKKLGRHSNKGALSHFAMLKSDEEEDEQFIRQIGASIRKSKNKKNRNTTPTQEKIFRKVSIPDFITVQELANRMTEKAVDIIKSLMKMGVMATVNQSIDADAAELIVLEFGHTPKRVTDVEVEKGLLNETPDNLEDMAPRAPVVTIMGHVDHGKTSLLDALRLTDVAAKEAGGITQHIGAYSVQLANGKYITFLDTPGHEAFTAMRMRGAKVTDVVILVVAADDGIKEQTIEAINHAKAANVPIIVAINKIDKPEANTERVKNELLSHGLVPEDMGGDTIVVNVSAKTKRGLDALEDTILVQAELMSLKANPKAPASGAVVEARMDKSRGAVATLLVQRGTLKIGDIIVVGTCYGKVKALLDDKGHTIKSCLPAYPVEVFGLNQAPVAGDTFTVVSNENTAKELVDFRMHKEKEHKAASLRKDPLERLFTKAKQDGSHKELAIIIKADVNGSAEAIANSLAKLPSDEVTLRILHSGVGGITESDVTLAAASRALVVGFNVRANNQARDMAGQLGVDIKYYSIIYNLIDDIKAAVSGLLSPIIKEKLLGYAEIRRVFDLSKFGKVAGCIVTEGMVQRNASARLLRDNIVIHEGKLKALKRFKEDVREVKAGFECGVSFERYEDIRIGDRIEVFSLTEESRQI